MNFVCKIIQHNKKGLKMISNSNKNDVIELIKGFLIGAIILSVFSATQKFFTYNKIVIELKFYIVPILFGGITGTIIKKLFIKRKNLIDEIKKDYEEMTEQKDEIEALYSQLEAYSQNIDALNNELNFNIKKYELIIGSISDFSITKKYSEKEFLSEIYNLIKDIIYKFDSGMIFIFENGFVKPIEVDGYDYKGLIDFKLEESIVNKIYPENNIYKIENSSIKLIIDQNRMDQFVKIVPNSKEILYLRLEFKNKLIGGLFLELDIKNNESYNENDLKVMEAISSIIESYYEANVYQEFEENKLIEIVEAMTNMLEFHDKYTKGHSLGVADIASRIGKYLKMSSREVNDLYLTGLLHDIGKTFIPYELLNKTDKLTDEEYEIVKEHPSNGAKVLQSINSLAKIRISVKHHHERWDGKGYPSGLKGDEISLETQIISVADAYDAMTTDRPYRKSLSKENAIQEIKNNCGKQFSPKICEVFLKLLDEEGFVNKELNRTF